jgi:imidazolonepropionase-like amidohydrolase
MMKKILSSLLFLFTVINSAAQQTPGAKQTEYVTIEGGTAHLGNGSVIENSLLVFYEGKLTFVGSALTKTKRKGRVINATGKQIYPGFIAANATLGLVEIDAVKASNDQREIGIMNPHIRSLIAYNAESKVVESMRPNGVLMAEVTPRGGTLSGTSSIVQLDAWNWEDATIKTDSGIHMNWPSSFISGKWWLGEDPALKPDEKYNENITKIESYFSDAKNYLAKKEKKIHLPFAATEGLFTGTKRLFIHVNGQKEITDAIYMFKKLEIPNLSIVQGEDAHKVADLLVKNNVSVILDRPHRNPDSEDDAYDATYTIAKTLIDQGVLISLGMQGQMERMQTRNLPFYAGTFAAFGLDKEIALQLITLNTAKILGIDAFTGSLEIGKDATLFISEGDALEMRGNILINAFIQGREISLETHQTKLWKRYSEKYKSK